MLLNLFITLSTIASPDIFSSIKHTRYLTLECYLICISPYFILSFFIFFLLNLEAKSIDFVLYSPKCIISLLSSNQSHILQKSSFNWFSILLNLYLDKQEMYHWHGEKDQIWQLVTCNWEILKTRVVLEYGWRLRKIISRKKLIC